MRLRGERPKIGGKNDWELGFFHCNTKKGRPMGTASAYEVSGLKVARMVPGHQWLAPAAAATAVTATAATAAEAAASFLRTGFIDF